MKDDNKFEYSYYAPTESERKEIEFIKKQYTQKSKQELKLERLKRLDSKVKNTPTYLSLTIGIIGILIFGLGLTMVLEWSTLIGGIIVMIVGAVPTALSYPLYKILLRKLKDKYSQEIIKLSNELLSNGEEVMTDESEEKKE